MRQIFLILIITAFTPIISQSSEPNRTLQQGEVNMRLNEIELALVYAVVTDCIDLLPDDIAVMLIDPNLDPILKGASDFNSTAQALTYSMNRANLGWQAAFVVKQLYDGKPPTNLQVPASVYYDAVDEPNVLKRLKITKTELLSKDRTDKSFYRAAVNLTLDLWLEDLRQSGQTVMTPTEGVYIRDEENHLYLYERAE